MTTYQQHFIEFALKIGALRFGQFTLKSGRISPYFFNSGLFNSGANLARLGHFYAETIVASGVDFDMLFGPAYKGIPLVSTTAIALADSHQQDVGYTFNRKENKDHGEGGQLVGAPLSGKILIVDDVVSAGTSINQSVAIISGQNATLAGVVIALDRQERGTTTAYSAIEEAEKAYNIPIIAIICLNDLLDYLKNYGNLRQHLPAFAAYHRQYGTKDN